MDDTLPSGLTQEAIQQFHAMVEESTRRINDKIEAAEAKRARRAKRNLVESVRVEAGRCRGNVA